jgi:hypothetical protein
VFAALPSPRALPAVLLAVLALGASGCESAAAPASESAADSPSAVPAQAKRPVAKADQPLEVGMRIPNPALADPPTPDAPQASPDDTPELIARMSRLAFRHAPGWIAASQRFEGELSEGQSQEYQVVLTGAHCFRALGVGSDSLGDLDLLLFDPAGVQVQQDRGSDRYPVLGLAYPVCPPRPGAYRLQVDAKAGNGAFALQVFHTDN